MHPCSPFSKTNMSKIDESRDIDSTEPPIDLEEFDLSNLSDIPAAPFGRGGGAHRSRGAPGRGRGRAPSRGRGGAPSRGRGGSQAVTAPPMLKFIVRFDAGSAAPVIAEDETHNALIRCGIEWILVPAAIGHGGSVTINTSYTCCFTDLQFHSCKHGNACHSVHLRSSGIVRTEEVHRAACQRVYTQLTEHFQHQLLAFSKAWNPEAYVAPPSFVTVAPPAAAPAAAAPAMAAEIATLQAALAALTAMVAKSSEPLQAAVEALTVVADQQQMVADQQQQVYADQQQQAYVAERPVVEPAANYYTPQPFLHVGPDGRPYMATYGGGYPGQPRQYPHGVP